MNPFNEWKTVVSFMQVKESKKFPRTVAAQRKYNFWFIISDGA